MATLRETNKNTQLDIINNLIASKTGQIAKYLGNLSLEDAKSIIESGYLDTKNKINSLNSQITDIQQLINKYKQKIKNIQLEKDNVLRREKSILDTELLRIGNKKEEQIEKIKLDIAIMENELHTLLNKERELEYTIKDGKEYIKTFKYNRAKLRYLHINQINNKHKAHKQLLEVKRELELQIVNLNSHITELQNKINNYDTSRYAINQDYYNWKKDNKLCEDIISSLNKDLTYIINNSLQSANLIQTQTINYDNEEIDIINTMLDINDLIVYSLKQCNLPLSTINDEMLSNTKLCPTLLSILELQQNKLPYNDTQICNDIISKLNRYQQTLSLYETLKDDIRQNTNDRYSKLKLERKKNLKRIGKLEKMVNKFQTELDKTLVFKKEKIVALELNNDEQKYNETQSLISKSSIELERIITDSANVQNALTVLEEELNTLVTEELPENLLNDKSRCISRWEKVQKRCEDKYDSECNDIAETIQLKFKELSTLQSQLKAQEHNWTNINNNPGLLLENYQHNLNNYTNVLREDISNDSSGNTQTEKQTQNITNVKNEIADIINMKRAISRIQSNR